MDGIVKCVVREHNISLKDAESAGMGSADGTATLPHDASNPLLKMARAHEQLAEALREVAELGENS